MLAFIICAGLLWDGIQVSHSDGEWRDRLGAERYCVMRKKATEPAFSGRYLDSSQKGTYHCAACDLALFASSSKYDAHNGWPAFREPIVQNHVIIKEDRSLPFRRYEVLCRSCESHLGHVFRESKTELRYTINSIALELHPSPFDGANYPPSISSPPD
jgi:peptide-methionine (R)-S-oxide reductase